MLLVVKSGFNLGGVDNYTLVVTIPLGWLALIEWDSEHVYFVM